MSKLYPSDLPDIFKGDQLVLAGRYKGAGEVTAKLTGSVNGEPQTFTYKVKFDDHNTQDEFIPRLWATRRIGYLLDETASMARTRSCVTKPPRSPGNSASSPPTPPT